MCRMLAIHARGEGLETARQLVLLLAEAASFDPYLEKIAGDPRHCHGYGYTLATPASRGWRIVHERFDAHPPLGLEEACKANLEELRKAAGKIAEMLKGVDEAMLVFHARRAGRSEPRGHTAAHPFREETILETPGGTTLAEVYLAHNGGVHKEPLAENLGLAGKTSLYTDSHLILKTIASRLNHARLEEVGDKLRDAIGEVKPHTKSALDLLILIAPPGYKPQLYAYGHIADRTPERQIYYQPIIVEGPGYKAYVSSTIKDLMEEHGIKPEKIEIIEDRLVKLST